MVISQPTGIPAPPEKTESGRPHLVPLRNETLPISNQIIFVSRSTLGKALEAGTSEFGGLLACLLSFHLSLSAAMLDMTHHRRPGHLEGHTDTRTHTHGRISSPMQERHQAAVTQRRVPCRSVSFYICSFLCISPARKQGSVTPVRRPQN